MKEVTKEFNYTGERVTIQLRYSDLEVSEFPKNCSNCPVGFRLHDCGIEFPIKNTRPKTCKLKLVKLDK